MAGAVKEMEHYVGFANLPNQVFRKSVQRGFEFTLMVVGQSGLGKSTLLNSLFLCNLYCDAVYPPAEKRTPSTTKVQTSSVELAEGGVRLKLTLVDTPGFGDSVDNSQCTKPIVDHIDQQFEEYLNAQSEIKRVAVPDRRVHACLYFIAPTGHGLKPLDIAVMKELHKKVNIIPLIAKSDTLTTEECEMFKKRILEEIEQNEIQVYSFPASGEDEEDVELNKQMRDRMPFAVVGSNTTVTVGGKKVRGRKYPWGVIDVENLEHCDFSALRNMLIRTHMQDLIETTDHVHFEKYRYNKLASAVNPQFQSKGSEARNPLAQFELEKKEHEVKMMKMQEEMEQVFEMKVMEKKQKLKDSEQDLQKRRDAMQANIDKQQRELEDRRRQFNDDKAEFEAQQRKYEQERDAMALTKTNSLSQSQKAPKDKKKDKKGLFS
ncbi:septin-7-like [Sycon ciliatum]|uniref:septin-7-like n=1 Tax=Sycon ciliatum TaxID=27933 RepID=UPI0020AAD20A|eukprot:scpid44580/ scgid33985/ Septin-7; CDC10 protein homolog &gt; Septin-7; CDC10 protein homolog &gt; Septin-7